MPLSQILIDGEGWKKVEGSGPRPRGGLPARNDTTLLWHQYTADFSTEYASPAFSRDVWRSRLDNPLKPIASTPYCPLRLKPGEKTIAVSGIVLDRDGRIYAATSLGIQVFDPIGRLCGVMAAPTGYAEYMHFENDQLTLWIGDTKYARKLNTRAK